MQISKLQYAINNNKNIRVIGFDDAPFSRERGSEVNIVGSVCSNTRFEGMLWGSTTRDGDDATDSLLQVLMQSKFKDQLHAILIDGLAFGGFNIVDLERLAKETQLPCVAVMRKHPDLEKIDEALTHFMDYERRAALIKKAGDIYDMQGFIFQIKGEAPEVIANMLEKLTDTGKVPEALRLSHLIGSAVKTGESSRRA